MSKVFSQMLVRDMFRKNKIKSVKRHILKPKIINEQNMKKIPWQQTKEERTKPTSWIDKKVDY